MSDVGSNSLLTAFVELRAKAAANFESDASAQVMPAIQRVAAEANTALAGSATAATAAGSSVATGLVEPLRSASPVIDEARIATSRLTREVLSLAGVNGQMVLIAHGVLVEGQQVARVHAEQAAAAAALAEAEAAATAATGGLAVSEVAATTAGEALLAALGPIGLIAAAAGAVFALGHLVQSTDEVKKSTVDFTKAIEDQNAAQQDHGETSQRSVDTLSAQALAANDAARQASAAGLSYKDMFDAVRNGGPELDKFTEALKSSGGDLNIAVDYLNRAGASTNTFGQELLGLLSSGKLNVDQVTALAEAVAGLSDKFQLDKTSADAVSSALGNLGAESITAAEAAKTLTAAIGVQSSAATGLLSSTGAVEAAESRVADARDKVRVAGERLNGGVQREQAALAEAVEAASSRIVDAQQHIIDARQAVADAEDKLAHAGEHEALAVNDAQDAVDAAQRKLNASTPEERGPAQHALDDAKQKLVDAKDALDRAKPDAQRALDAAVRGVNDAMRAEADAHRSLADAQQKAADGSHLAEQAQRDYDTAVRSVNDAVLAQAQAVANQKQLQEELASGIKTGPVEALGLLKDAYKAAAAELDPNSPDTARLLYLLASLSGAPVEVSFATPAVGSDPGRVTRRAAGGPVGAGEVFMGAEYGPELLMLNKGPGLYRSPGAGVVYPTGTGPAEHRTVEEHHYHMHLNATVTIDAVRREFDRMMVLRESSRSLVGAAR